jgi:hypothetical protein
MPTVDKWLDIYSDLRVWSDAREVHKMGWLRAGDRIHLSDQYNTWFHVDNVIGGDDLDLFDGDYNEYWVRGPELEIAATLPGDDEPEPEPELDPEGPSDAELGAAVRIFFAAFWAELEG